MTTSVVPRLQPLEPPHDAEVQRTLERMMGGTGIEPLKLFRIVAHNRRFLDKFRSTGTYLLNFGTIDPLEREIVIHRTCARCGSEYEWGVHVVVFGRSVGLTDEQLWSTVHGTADDPVWTARQALLVRLVDELHETSGVSDELWEQLAGTWSAEHLVELVALVGQYHTVSFLTNALGVELEDDARRFPAVPRNRGRIPSSS
jgi:4-carboxymuconolactone decarboxylase